MSLKKLSIHKRWHFAEYARNWGNTQPQPKELDSYVIVLYQDASNNFVPTTIEFDEQQWLDFCGVLEIFNRGDTPEDLDRNITLIIGAKA